MRKTIISALVALLFATCSCGGQATRHNSCSEDHACDILALHPANEFVPLLLSARKPAPSRSGEPFQSLTLLQFSDLHGCEANLERIVRFRRAYSEYIDDAIHVGDAVWGYTDDPNPWDKVEGAREILNIVGNHDCWKGHKLWAESEKPYDATREDAYKKMLIGEDSSKPFVEGWGVTQPQGVNDEESPNWCACWYFKDYEEAAIRLVVLDCIHYDSDQDRWLVETLADAAEKGLTVVGATHYPAQNGVDAAQTAFTSPEMTIDAIDNPDAVQFERTPDLAFTRVDEFKAAGGKFACWLSGHTHLDYVGLVSGHDCQIQLIVDKSGEMDQYMFEDRTPGTKNQDAFNLVTINPSRHQLVIIRIGCDRDTLMRSKKMLCMDYLSGEVIVSE